MKGEASTRRLIPEYTGLVTWQIVFFRSGKAGSIGLNKITVLIMRQWCLDLK